MILNKLIIFREKSLSTLIEKSLKRTESGYELILMTTAQVNDEVVWFIYSKQGKFVTS